MNTTAHPKVGRQGLAGAGGSSRLNAWLRGWDAGRPQATGRRRGARRGSTAALSVVPWVRPRCDLRAGSVSAETADFADGAARGDSDAAEPRPFGVAFARLPIRRRLIATVASCLLRGALVTAGCAIIVPQVHGSSAPPVGTLCRFQAPHHPPSGGEIARMVYLPTGPAGGATFALPLAPQLGDCDQVRLKREQPRPRGRLAHVLYLPLGAAADRTVGHADLNSFDGGGSTRVDGSGRARGAAFGLFGLSSDEFCP